MSRSIHPSMIKRRLFKFRSRSAGSESTSSSFTPREEEDEQVVEEEVPVAWEIRPGGMLVQKRFANSGVAPPPNLRIQVTYDDARYQISTNSQSTFGELKKLLTAETGLQPGEQRLTFRGKERENVEYLDTCGVKDRSKLILTEDPESKRRKLLEMRRSAKLQAARRLIDGVSTEVDRLAEQVCVIEKSIASGKKVAELQITTLTEMLMRQAVKLDTVAAAEGDACACANKDSQGKRVQKCVETLDELKALNARKEKVPPVAATTAKWDTIDLSPSLIQWELFD